jgi:hypothetical protein
MRGATAAATIRAATTSLISNAVPNAATIDITCFIKRGYELHGKPNREICRIHSDDSERSHRFPSGFDRAFSTARPSVTGDFAQLPDAGLQQIPAVSDRLIISIARPEENTA